MCYNMDEPWKHYAKWKKPDTKGHVLYGVSSIGKYIETEGKLMIAYWWENGGLGGGQYLDI